MIEIRSGRGIARWGAPIVVLAAVLWSAPAAAQMPPDMPPEPAATVEPPVDESWFAQVDRVFGEYLVAPLDAALFFDLRRVLPESIRQRLPQDEKAKIPLIVIWLLVGAAFFTVRMSVVNVWGFGHAVRLTKGDYDDPDNPGEVSHFQALTSALAATLGLGNIAGVAIGVGIGGPGVVVWLIVAGLLGMASKFTECSLGQMYRHVAPDGTVSGGPQHYLREGLAEMGLGWLGAPLAIAFCILCIGGTLGGGCAFQASQSADALLTVLALDADENTVKAIYGVVMAALVGIVIIGGIRRIATTAEKVVPLMCALYMAMSLYILAVHANELGEAARTIWDGAFTPSAAYGGFIGVLIMGVRRAAFSNEAGVGSAAIAHAAARTKEPMSEGFVSLLEPFFDTVVVCTITGLVIVVTGVYDDPETAALVRDNKGAALTAAAFKSGAAWFPWPLALAIVLFAYATMIAWSYYGERCWAVLFGRRSVIVYKIIYLSFVFLGSIVTARKILDFSDLMILSMALPNLIGLVLLSGKVRRGMLDYWGRLQSGEIRRRR